MAEDTLNKLIRGETAILVAEKEPIPRSSLSELLRDEGYQVLEASNSTSAINLMNDHNQLRVILTDLEMPGWGALIKHARIAIPNAFVLCMAAPLSIEEITQARRLGACGHFLKPLDFEVLHQSMQNLLTVMLKQK
jgi:CheY-like chemotaxis protein